MGQYILGLSKNIFSFLENSCFLFLGKPNVVKETISLEISFFEKKKKQFSDF